MRRTLICSAFLAALAATPAHAGFKLTIDGTGDFGANAPIFRLENLHGSALTGFRLTIGDTDFGFDYLFPEGESQSALSGNGITIVEGQERPSGADDNSTTPAFQLSFDDPLATNEELSWGADIDEVDGNSAEDFQSILFNNGASVTNSVATAYFGNDTQLSLELPDGNETQAVYTYEAVVPLPAALPLFAGGLAGIAFVTRRRRSAG